MYVITHIYKCTYTHWRVHCVITVIRKSFSVILIVTKGQLYILYCIIFTCIHVQTIYWQITASLYIFFFTSHFRLGKLRRGDQIISVNGEVSFLCSNPRTHVHIHTRTHARTHARTQTHTHTDTYTHTHTHTHACTQIHTHTHTHMHTRSNYMTLNGVHKMHGRVYPN